MSEKALKAVRAAMGFPTAMADAGDTLLDGVRMALLFLHSAGDTISDKDAVKMSIGILEKSSEAAREILRKGTESLKPPTPPEAA